MPVSIPDVIQPNNNVQYGILAFAVVILVLILIPYVSPILKSRFSKKADDDSESHLCHQKGNIVELGSRMENVEKAVDELKDKLEESQAEVKKDFTRVHERLDDLFKILLEKMAK
jgi:flagellar biosynthesis/type III secretory pathway M-ring protein FliF/YscJ